MVYSRLVCSSNRSDEHKVLSAIQYGKLASFVKGMQGYTERASKQSLKNCIYGLDLGRIQSMISVCSAIPSSEGYELTK